MDIGIVITNIKTESLYSLGWVKLSNYLEGDAVGAKGTVEVWAKDSKEAVTKARQQIVDMNIGKAIITSVMRLE